MLAVERDVKTPKYELCKGREEGGGGGAINREGACITKNTVDCLLINYKQPL